MKVTELKTGKLLDVNDSYGARLVEQGKAVPTPPVAEEKAKPRKGKNGGKDPSASLRSAQDDKGDPSASLRSAQDDSGE